MNKPKDQQEPTNPLKKRSIAREYAFKFLYHLMLDDFKTLKKEILEENFLEQRILEFDEKSLSPIQNEEAQLEIDLNTKTFAKSLIEGVLTNEEELLKEISLSLTSWKLESLNRLDLAIIMLGAYELIKIENSQLKIVISEYNRIANSYSSQEAPSFINAILDKVGKKHLKAGQ